MKNENVFGFHAINAILDTDARRVQLVYLLQGRQDKRAQELLARLSEHGVKPELVSKDVLDGFSKGSHQGVVAQVLPARQYHEQDLYQMVEKSESTPLILVLDGITDPHNLGACLRTADAAGVMAVIVPKDNSAGLSDVARKVASGAADTVPLIAVTNLARALKKLQELGLWVTGTAGETDQLVFDADLSGPRVIVMGAEGKGMRRLTRECCDELVKIPMRGVVSSLNVSVATGVVLFEVLRQRA